MRARFAAAGLLFCAAVAVASGGGVPDDAKTVEHALNRIAFGPRAGDIDRVRALGLQQYIDQQLHPDHVADADVDARLAGLSTLTLSSREIAEQFALPAIAARRERQRQSSSTDQPAAPQTQMPAGPEQIKANRVMVELGEQKILRAVYSERQLQEVLTDFWFNHFNVDARKGPERFMLTEYERDMIRPRVLGRFRDLLGATAKAPAMLFYLDNWMSSDPDGPHASAEAPRVARGPFGRPRFVMPSSPRPENQKKAPMGLNENYARELMELHTLGVDGGYTQKDVTEVARAFTGWTIRNPRAGGGFYFDPRRHDPGEKIVLGHKINAGGGEGDGERVLDILASHPATARLIATELARRFVADTPPPSLVDRAAARFRQTDGDLREVTRTIITSPEFLSADAMNAKFKTPFGFVVSALRTTGASIDDAMPLVRALQQQLGMPLYQCQPPTGYKDTADAWINSGALVGRMNFALQLAENRLPGTRVNADRPQDLALSLGGPDFQKR